MTGTVKGTVKGAVTRVGDVLLRALAVTLVTSLLGIPAPHDARADACDPVAPVFDGDPCDPVNGPFPMLPGLPLVLPQAGPTGRWSDGAPVITTGPTGDVDLAVRVGSFATETAIPPPAGSSANPTLIENVAGGGGAGQGGRVSFTVFVTDGPGDFPFGAPLAGLDERPVAVFGYADLDGDGLIGPTDTDGSNDNEVEKQEAIGHVGRQAGQIGVDRFGNQLAVRIGAPASIGGLRISLVAGMYTGDDPDVLWSNGTPIFTSWPFFPPLDPFEIIYLVEPNPPDSNGPNIIFYQPAEFLLPAPATTDLAEAFVVDTDGGNPSTDQYLSVSGPAVGARMFRDVDSGNFTASSRLAIRPAPANIGAGRKLVAPAGEIVVKTGSNATFRLLPVDALGNIADPDGSGVSARITVEGGLRILSPDVDKEPFEETVTLDKARGQFIRIGTDGIVGLGLVTVSAPPPALPTGLDQAKVFVSVTGDVDADDDGVPDDGDGSGTIGDLPCTADLLAQAGPCDDNCPNVVNPSQNDGDGDGQGNCCDGTCVLNDGEAGCMECPQAASRFQAENTRARLRIRPRDEPDVESIRFRALLREGDGQALVPDAESVEITVVEGDRLHYFVQLPGVFSLSDDRPTYMYEDETGSLGGVTYARLRTARRGMRMRLRANGLDLVDTNPGELLANGLVLAVTVGDDTFTRHLKCVSTLSDVRCSSSD